MTAVQRNSAASMCLPGESLFIVQVLKLLKVSKNYNESDLFDLIKIQTEICVVLAVGTKRRADSQGRKDKGSDCLSF